MSQSVAPGGRQSRGRFLIAVGTGRLRWRERERERERETDRRRHARSRFCTRYEGRVQVRSASHPLPLEASNHLSTGTSYGAIGSGVFGGETSEGARTRRREGARERRLVLRTRWAPPVPRRVPRRSRNATRRDASENGGRRGLSAGRFVLRLCNARWGSCNCSRDTP